MKRQACKIIAAVVALIMVLCTSAMADIARGAKGDDVVRLQKKLAFLGYLSGSADGDFGGGTERAVKAFQQAQGISQTGVVDDATAQALARALIETQADGVFGFTSLLAPAYPEVGFNKNGDTVYSVAVLSTYMPEAPFSFVTSSWDDDIQTHQEMSEEDTNKWWKDNLQGKTHIFLTSDDEISRAYVCLPDNSELAGNQSITFKAGDFLATYKFYLTYNGGYTDGTGWDFTFSGITASTEGEPSEPVEDADMAGSALDRFNVPPIKDELIQLTGGIPGSASELRKEYLDEMLALYNGSQVEKTFKYKLKDTGNCDYLVRYDGYVSYIMLSADKGHYGRGEDPATACYSYYYEAYYDKDGNLTDVQYTKMQM